MIAPGMNDQRDLEGGFSGPLYRVLAWSGRRAAALPALLSVAGEASRDRPALAWDALGSAATVAYQSGTPASRQAVSRTLGLLERQGPQPAARAPGIDVDVLRLWIRASADPVGSRY